ncbi:MAG: zinc-ribbon domain-containing protein, partial [Planktomarina sp.]
MRLTCTNCDARYEVPDDAVPAAGRDVQCSNCGHTWFAKPKPLGAASRSDDPTPVSEPTPPQRTAAKQPNQDYRDVLRQEAIRELEARKADADPDLEIQPDLGVTTPAAVAPSTQSIHAAAASVSVSEAHTDDESPSRRNQLPDIEEINSSLSAAPVKKREKRVVPTNTAQKRRKRRRGFRLGFVFALVVLAIMTSLYVYA